MSDHASWNEVFNCWNTKLSCIDIHCSKHVKSIGSDDSSYPRRHFWDSAGILQCKVRVKTLPTRVLKMTSGIQLEYIFSYAVLVIPELEQDTPDMGCVTRKGP